MLRSCCLRISRSAAPTGPLRGGFLGDQFDAFRVYDPGRDIPNLKANVASDRQARRIANLAVVSRPLRAEPPASRKTLHQRTIEHALEMMSSDQLTAFQLDGEPKRLRDSYGASPFGRGCLLARRLVETGVRAVEVTLSGFDTHANNFNGHRQNARVLDPALTALLRDLRERDLLQSTVVLVLGEFGRSPAINALDGRDHWPSGFSCLIGGGGLKQGLVIGATDPEGQRKTPSRPDRSGGSVCHDPQSLRPRLRPRSDHPDRPADRLQRGQTDRRLLG